MDDRTVKFWSEAQRLADAHGPQIGPDDSDFRDTILLDGDPVRNLETLRYIREGELIRDEFEHFLKLDDSELDLLATGTLPLIDALEEVTKAQIEGLSGFNARTVLAAKLRPGGQT